MNMRHAMRGYTLIEIAIVLTIILMMSSFLAVNVVNFEQNRRNRETAQQMEIIKSAVLGYATAHKTVARDLTVINQRFPAGLVATVVTPLATMTMTVASPPVTLHWQLPGGRPYFPCPDITGDGYEDRITPVDGGLTIIVTDAPTRGAYPLETTGGCYSSRGIVPWRTLNALGQQNTPAKDNWGTRFSYRVSDSFANAITGFDQQSVADLHYRARPLSPVDSDIVDVERFSFGDSVMVTHPLWRSLERYLSPAVICAESPCPREGRLTNRIVVPIVAGNFAVDGRVTITRPVAVEPVGGEFEGSQIIEVDMGNMVSGIPFVIISHGRNGYGGVRSDIPGFHCNVFPDTRGALEALYWDEMQNAVWLANSGDRNNANCEQTDTMFPEAGFVDGINHWQDGTNYGGRREGVNHDYDDLVTWMSAEEIIANLVTRGTLPARLLPPIGLEKSPPELQL